jgi:hypothetical protein
VKADVVVKNDLSGTIDLVYTVSREFIAMGALDGNAAWPTLPVGRADFERSVARIDGLSLKSFRERTSGANQVFEASLHFDDPDAFAAFMSANGQSLVYENSGGKTKFTFVFNDGSGTLDDDITSLAETAFEGYNFDWRIAVPGDKKTFAATMASLLTSSKKETLDIVF